MGSFEEGFDTRGFSARRGTRAKLLRRRGPKAPCEMRGRAAFARSARAGRRRRPSRGPGREEARAGLLRECRGALRDPNAELHAHSPDGYGHLWRNIAEIEGGELVAVGLGIASGRCDDLEADLSDLSTCDGGAGPPSYESSEARALLAADLSDLSTTCDGDAPPPPPSEAGAPCAGEAEAGTDVSLRAATAGAPALLRQRSLPVTPAERRDAEARRERAAIPLRSWSRAALLAAPWPRDAQAGPRGRPRAARWEQAAARAAGAARAVSAARAAGAARAEGAQQPGRARRSSVENEATEALASFEQLREGFLRDHERVIRRSLGRCFEGRLSLRPAPVSASVQEKFMGACRDCGLGGRLPKARLSPTFHGTHASNHDSIFASGLLIPGQAGIKVHNGASHGRGVYTSSVESAWLSGQFCSAPRMLVCGVLDDAVALKSAYRLGNFMVTAESAAVRHVGDAVVVFDVRRVVPLFEALAERLVATRAAPAAPAQPAPRPAAEAPADPPPGRRAARAARRARSSPRPAAAAGGTAAFLARRAARRRR